MAFEIEFDPDSIKDLKRLDKPVQQRLISSLKERVAPLETPRQLGEALTGATLGNYWKYRVGDWRIVCDIQDKRIVVRVLRAGNRRDVYR